MARESLEKLLGLFNLSKKRDVERYCQNLVVTSEDFADVLLASRVAGLGPYRYACHFAEMTPNHLHPKDEELTALGANGVGPLKGSALKAMRKVNQIFRDRRLLAMHLFYVPSQKYWHLFYFDQRDNDDHKNHWKHGPHIHYSQDLFTKEPLGEVWSRATSDKPSFPPSLHIRYDYHHNRHRSP
jgi:hypothetical protein